MDRKFGSEAGIRQKARPTDGWLASAYNTTPERFCKGLDLLANALATMWCYVTEDRAVADEVLSSVVAPMLGRDADELRRQLFIGPVDECREKMDAYRQEGVQRVFIWPVKDPLKELDVFMRRVAK